MFTRTPGIARRSSVVGRRSSVVGRRSSVVDVLYRKGSGLVSVRLGFGVDCRSIDTRRHADVGNFSAGPTENDRFRRAVII